MQESPAWRELLSKCIRDPRERQRIANILGVTPITLTRWVNREANPRSQSLQLLPTALPQYREELLRSIAEEFEGIFPAIINEDSPLEISAEFYARILHTFGTIPSSLRYSSLCDLILHQALIQLDPHRLGLAIIVV